MPELNKKPFDKIVLLLLSLFFCYHQIATAQVQPIPGDTLNYRLVGFRAAAQPGAKTYLFEIASGHHTDEKHFKKNIFFSKKSASSKLVAEVPEFGKAYTWRVSYNGKKQKSTLYHFTTGTTEYADTSKTRLRVINNAGKYKEMLIILDHAPVMYDMNGKLVWYLPDIPGVITKGLGLRDIKPTAAGTFTLLNNYGAFEFDYNGKVLWSAPNNGIISGDSVENYHHEFTRLSNGHYMVAGAEYIKRRVPADADTTHFINDKTLERKDGWFYKSIDCPTLIEYDSAGTIVWHWRSSEYFTDEDYFTNKNPDGTYMSAPHMNSFYLDEKDSVLYLGFRNLNRIIKLQYPTAKTLAVYGEKTATGRRPGNMLFRAQHCVRADSSGLVYLFNNNGDRERNVASYVARYRQPENPDGNLIKIWEFSCAIDSNAPGLALAGGSTYLLPDGAILATMGIVGRTFIVDQDKNVLWNALPQFKNDNNEWVIQPEYRGNFIESHKTMEKYIFR